MKIDSESQTSARLEQLEIQQKCHHPEDSWEPFDWYNPTQTFPELVSAHAEQQPSRLALIDPAITLTYSELNLAANAVAAAIIEQRGPGQEAVALLVGVDARAIIAALGVLKARKFYVALEETFPIYRHQQILDDADVTLILTDQQNLFHARELAVGGRILIRLETLPRNASNPKISPPSLDDLAILNYTSGTTGKPKGVMQSHRSALAQAVRFVSSYHICVADRLALFHSLAWVDSFWDFIGGLSLGACITPVDLRRVGLYQMVKWLQSVEPSMVVSLTVLREIEKTPLMKFFHLSV